MKQIIKFKADDGTEFDSEMSCKEYEVICARVEAIVCELPPRPNLPHCHYENGGGYLQHDPVAFKQVRYRLLELANELSPHHWFVEAMNDENVHPSYPARLIGEMPYRALDKAWSRIYCTDKQFREWGQVYYAENPTKGHQVRLNQS